MQWYKRSNCTNLFEVGPFFGQFLLCYISLLPDFSKIIEKIIYVRIHRCLNKYDILNCKQFGFRKNRSTSHILSKQIQYIYPVESC